MNIAELKEMNISGLAEVAKDLGVAGATGMRKQELIFKILQAQTEQSGLIFSEGVLECLPDGFGFLRAPEYNYLPGPHDIYVSPSQIRKFDLRTGDTISGQFRPPKGGERYFALIKVEAVNFEPPEAARERIFFDNLMPLYPQNRIRELMTSPCTDRCMSVTSSGRSSMRRTMSTTSGWLAQARRRHPPRFHHPARPRLQHRGSALGKSALGRCRLERAPAAQALLRRRPEHRGGRLAHHHGDRPHRDGKPHGRRHLRGVQGHGQHGDPLDRKLVDKRVFPSIDINKSGTRKEELLLSKEELNRVWILRKVLSPLSQVEAMELLLDKMGKTKSNAEFLSSMSGQ